MRAPIIHRTAVAIYFFCCGCIFATWAARIPSIKENFHFNEAELGAVLFMLPFGSLVALPFAGWSISKLGSRFMTFMAAIIYPTLLILIGYSNTPFVLSFLLFFFGFFGDVLNIAMNTQAIFVQEEMYGRPMLSFFHAMWSVGALTGAAAGGFLMKAGFTTLNHFWIIAAFTFTLAVIFLSYLVPREKFKQQTQKLFAWPDKTLWLLGAICFCCALCEGAMADWSSLYYKQVINDLQKVSTTGYTSFALMMALGRLIGDRLTERLGYKGILMMDSLLVAGGLALAIFLPSAATVIIGFGMVGFGVATIIPIVYSLSGRSKTMTTSSALAAVSTVGFTGFLVGPPIIGFVAHEIGLRWALLIVLTLGLIIFWLSKKTKFYS